LLFSSVNAASTVTVDTVRHYDHALVSEGNLAIQFEPAIGETEVPPDPCKTIYDYGCSCILYIKSKGIPIKGNAWDLIPNYWGTPTTGDVALFKYASTSHAAYVEGAMPSGHFLVSECNYRKATCGERIISKTDPFLIGFIRVPRVSP